MMTVYRAMPCPCGHKTCRAWMVNPVAAVQGVSFTRDQAEAVAAFLTARENALPAEDVKEGRT